MHKNIQLAVFSILFVIFAGAVSAFAQNVEVKEILLNADQSRCFRMTGNSVIDAAKFEEIVKRKGCETLKESLQIDLEKHTLISYHVGGDCMMRLRKNVSRDDSEKKLVVEIFNIWGGCRAGGRLSGLLAVDKIPSDFTIEFVVHLVEEDTRGGIAERETGEIPASQNDNLLKTREISLAGCIQTFTAKEFAITSNKQLLNAIRKDASRESCLENLENIDFDRFSLLGMNINSGYCRRPLELRHQVFKDDFNQKYLLSITYKEPRGVCRAISSYDLWILVPKLPAGYTVDFSAEPEPAKQ